MAPGEIIIQVLRGLLGLAAIVGIAWLLSSKRGAIDWRLVLAGLGLQIALAALTLVVPGVADAFDWVAGKVVQVLNLSFKGTDILFLGMAEPAKQHATLVITIFATIVFVSSLTALLYYFRVLSWLVYGMAWVMRRVMRLSGPECLSAAANVFVGQTEAPLLVKPYLKNMTRSELMALMTGGMATIAGSVLLVYVTVVGGADLEAQKRIAKLLLSASLMSAPASLVMAKIFIPETAGTQKELLLPRQNFGFNAFDAATRGASDGLKLALNVITMIVAFYALIYLGNAILSWFGNMTGLNGLVAAWSGGVYASLSIQAIASVLFAPLGFLIGVDLKDVFAVGELIGTKIFFTDFIAFQSFAGMNEAGALSPKTAFVTTFALCGFANFVSIGVQLGGITALEPSQRENITSLGLKAMTAGVLASLMTASVAGMFFAG